MCHPSIAQHNWSFQSKILCIFCHARWLFSIELYLYYLVNLRRSCIVAILSVLYGCIQAFEHLFLASWFSMLSSTQSLYHAYTHKSICMVLYMHIT